MFAGSGEIVNVTAGSSLIVGILFVEIFSGSALKLRV